MGRQLSSAVRFLPRVRRDSVKSGDTFSQVGWWTQYTDPQALNHERRTTPSICDEPWCDAMRARLTLPKRNGKRETPERRREPANERRVLSDWTRTRDWLIARARARASLAISMAAPRDGSRPKRPRRCKRQISIGACSLRATECGVMQLWARERLFK